MFTRDLNPHPHPQPGPLPASRDPRHLDILFSIKTSSINGRKGRNIVQTASLSIHT